MFPRSGRSRGGACLFPFELPDTVGDLPSYGYSGTELDWHGVELDDEDTWWCGSTLETEIWDWFGYESFSYVNHTMCPLAQGASVATV